MPTWNKFTPTHHHSTPAGPRKEIEENDEMAASAIAIGHEPCCRLMPLHAAQICAHYSKPRCKA